MKKNIILIFAALAALVSCEEFQPVFTNEYPDPSPSRLYQESEIPGKKITIAELKKMYEDNGLKPVEVTEDVFIAGKVTTNDYKGNFYRSFFIQDETSGIEVKIGKYNLYNEYKEGQTVYIRCKGFTVGGYKGMVGLGYRVEDTTSDYETAYIEVDYLVSRQILRGAMGEKVAPVQLTPNDDLSKYVGMLVKLPRMQYTGRIFFMGYVDANGNRKDYTNNCFFCDEESVWEVPTWAMSADLYYKYLQAGTFDAATVRGTTVGELRKTVAFTKQAYSISQYFLFGNFNIQVRTSGYSKFADEYLDPQFDPQTMTQEDLLKGKSVTMTGVLSTYNGEYQFTISDLDTDFIIN